jgi:hypothetical protein
VDGITISLVKEHGIYSIGLPYMVSFMIIFMFGYKLLFLRLLNNVKFIDMVEQ